MLILVVRPIRPRLNAVQERNTALFRKAERQVTFETNTLGEVTWGAHHIVVSQSLQPWQTAPNLKRLNARGYRRLTYDPCSLYRRTPTLGSYRASSIGAERYSRTSTSPALPGMHSSVTS